MEVSSPWVANAVLAVLYEAEAVALGWIAKAGRAETRGVRGEMGGYVWVPR
jgi:hypothetical protein